LKDVEFGGVAWLEEIWPGVVNIRRVWWGQGAYEGVLAREERKSQTRGGGVWLMLGGNKKKIEGDPAERMGGFGNCEEEPAARVANKTFALGKKKSSLSEKRDIVFGRKGLREREGIERNARVPDRPTQESMGSLGE